jgi:hypothetical protein
MANEWCHFSAITGARKGNHAIGDDAVMAKLTQ